MSVHLFTSFSGVQHEELHVVIPEGAERAQREAGQRGGGGAPRQGPDSNDNFFLLEKNSPDSISIF